MTIRTLVISWRVFWSWLIKGAAKDKIKLSPSSATPSILEEKNIGQLNMANPYVVDNQNNLNMANPYITNNENNFGLANAFIEKQATDTEKLQNQSVHQPPKLVHAQWSRLKPSELPNMVSWSEPTDAGTVPSSWLCDDEQGSKFKKQIALFKKLKSKRSPTAFAVGGEAS